MLMFRYKGLFSINHDKAADKFCTFIWNSWHCSIFSSCSHTIIMPVFVTDNGNYSDISSTSCANKTAWPLKSDWPNRPPNLIFLWMERFVIKVFVPYHLIFL